MATKIRGRQIETDDFIKSVRNSDLDWTNDVNTASQKAIAQLVGNGQKIVFLTATQYGSNYKLPKTPDELMSMYDQGITVVVDVAGTQYYRSAKGAVSFFNVSTFSYKVLYYYTNDGINTEWYVLTRNIQQQLTSGSNIRTVNNTSLLGSGNIDTESWSVEQIADGTTTKTIVPTTTHSHIFINNSSNTDDLNVTIDNTGIDIVFEEYETLIVKANTTCRFDVKKFTDNNTVYASVKRTNLYNAYPSYYGVTSFRADDVYLCMLELGVNDVNDYLVAIQTPNSAASRPSIFTKTGQMTFNNTSYYTYSIQDGYYDGYYTASEYIMIVPTTFAFTNSKKLENCTNNITNSRIDFYYLLADNLIAYKGNNMPQHYETRNLIDFVP